MWYFVGGSNSESRWEPELQGVHHLQPCITVPWTLFTRSSSQPWWEEGEADTHHQQEVAPLTCCFWLQCKSLVIFKYADQIGFYCLSKEGVKCGESTLHHKICKLYLKNAEILVCLVPFGVVGQILSSQPACPFLHYYCAYQCSDESKGLYCLKSHTCGLVTCKLRFEQWTWKIRLKKKFFQHEHGLR